MRPSPTTLLGTTLAVPGARSAADPPCAYGDDRACPPDEQLALLTSGSRATAATSSEIRTAHASSPVIAPFATAVLHTPLTSASLVALDPRAGRELRVDELDGDRDVFLHEEQVRRLDRQLARRSLLEDLLDLE